MAEATAGETYEAFKARKRGEFNARHTGRSQTTQQKLLRVHLRRFLLTVGTDVDHERRRTGDYEGFVNREGNADGIEPPPSFATEQIRLAVAREAAKAKRKRSAQLIQKSVRRRISQILANQNEEELPSISVLIPLEIEKAVAPLKPTTDNIPVDVNITPDPSFTAALPPYELVINVVGVRDLALDFTTLDGKYLETELQLKCQSAVVSRNIPARHFFSSFQDSNTELPLQGCLLRFSMDLNNGVRHGLASPQSVIDELSATVIVKTTENHSGGNANTLGMVEIPLSLLETPLATEYALCRWFPLEKAYPGHTARGDVRVSVYYLMRQLSSDCDTMVPYVNSTSAMNVSDEAKVQQKRATPMPRRAKKAPTTSTKPAGKSFLQNRAEKTTDKSDKLKSPVLSLKDAFSSPIGRISRAEALSPPPSPSSVTSSDAGENIDSPKTVKPRRLLFSSKRQQKVSKHVKSSPPKEEQEVETKVNSSGTPPKTFLKRKPYKVVFQKLNWSSVASKTDSNLPTNNKNHKNSNVATGPSKTTRTSSRASNSSIIASNSGEAEQGADAAFIPKPGVFIDAATAERLAALETAMYEQCSVTRETVSLSRFKYQRERRKFVATLQSQAQDRLTGREDDQPPSQGSSELETCTATSEAAVTELWKKLTGDSSGHIYASMLRNLTEKTAKNTIEPTEPGTVS